MANGTHAIKLDQFIGRSQLSVMRAICRAEEGQFFRERMKAITSTIQIMPRTYHTDGQGNAAVAFLHYFSGGSDWYITERDQEVDQLQAFGFACLNGDTQNAELGYISISELVALNVDFDLYYTPETIGAIKTRLGIC